MPTTDDLSNYIQGNDIKGFMLCYMQLVDGGHNLSVPSHLELKGIQDGWQEILPNVTGGYSDEFVLELSKYWFSVVKKQGGKVGDNFTKEIIAIIEGKPTPNIQKKQAPKKPIQTTDTEATPTVTSPTNAPVGNEVASNISSHYYSYQGATETMLLSQKELTKNVREAINYGDANEFLVNYLSFSRHNERIQVPLSTVLKTISTGWENIILGKFNLKPSGVLVKAITSKWFYLVNHKGLPSTNEKMQDLLYYLISTLPKPENDSSEKKTVPIKEPKGILAKIKYFFS
ncbi:hypothetical protein ACFL2K_03080 [Candidatus Margulisiibacteriota bacterium]